MGDGDKGKERFERHIIESVATEVSRRVAQETHKLKQRVANMEEEVKKSTQLVQQRDKALADEKAKTRSVEVKLDEEIQARKRAELTVKSLQDSLVKEAGGSESGDYAVVLMTVAEAMKFGGAKEGDVRRMEAAATWAAKNPHIFIAFHAKQEHEAVEAEKAVAAGEETKK